MRRENNSRAVCLNFLHEFPEIPARLRIEPRRRLIEEYEFRPVDQRNRKKQPLPLAAR